MALYGTLVSQEADMDPIDIAFLTLRLYHSIIRLASEGIFNFSAAGKRFDKLFAGKTQRNGMVMQSALNIV